MPMPREQKSEATRALILNSAIELAQEVGFEKLSIRAICKRADVSVGAFYHHFESKEHLINESFLHFDITLSDDARAQYAAMPPLDALKAVLLDQTRFTAMQGYVLVTEYYRALLQNRHRGAVNPERLYYRAVRSCVKRAQAEGLFVNTLSATEITELFVRFVRGCLIDWCLHDGAYDVCALTEREVDVLISANRLPAF